MDRLLIVGGGQAAAQVALSLREEGFAGEVTIVGDEPWLPYQRPPLSKSFLSNEQPEESLRLREQSVYDAQKISVITGEAVERVWFSGEGHARTRLGRTFAFDRLILATGAAPRKLDIEGAQLHGVHYLRSLHDAIALRAAWGKAQHAVVIGGGFIGLELAAAARRDGKTVTVLEVADRLIGRAVSVETSSFFLRYHRAHGIDVQLEARIKQISGVDDQVSSVQLADGTLIRADLVIVGIGAAPRTDLASQLGLGIERGAILVDRSAQTTDPRVFAIGDVSLQPHPTDPCGGLIRLESVQNAVDQAKVAARTIVGLEVRSATVPWFWSDQAELKLQIAGLSVGHDLVVVRDPPEDGTFTALYYLRGRLIGIDAVNAPADYVLVRRMLTAGESIDAEAAADTSRPLRSIPRSSL